jgi:phosphoglycerate dehydrogenase-like enzyme
LAATAQGQNLTKGRVPTVNALRDKIESGSAVVGVIGLGYVGLPLARAFWQAGFRVIGFEVDPKKVGQLNAGQSYLKHLGERFVADMAKTDRFVATSDMSRMGECDALILCVPTPLGNTSSPTSVSSRTRPPPSGRRCARANSSCLSRQPTPARRAT